ncbi:hypothetical protein M3Y94_00590500 [Aphelenchoides besseyi]|nr:hypothetical protein M3Y94_00590500 [Aphelenchoides besseyi]
MTNTLCGQSLTDAVESKFGRENGGLFGGSELTVQSTVAKFRFVGGLDCPDWVLAEIAEFTKINTNDFRQWCQTIANRLKSKQMEWKNEEIEVLRKNNQQIDLRGVKGAITALGFILEKSAKNECTADDLEKEMLQLGMGAEHAKQLNSVYRTENVELTRILSADFIREPSLNVLLHDTQMVDGDVLVHKIECQTSDGKAVNLAIEDSKFQLLQKELERSLDVIRPYCK